MNEPQAPVLPAQAEGKQMVERPIWFGPSVPSGPTDNDSKEEKWQERESELLRGIHAANAECEELRPYKKVFVDLDKRFDCNHIDKLGDEGARELIRHIDELFDEQFALRARLQKQEEDTKREDTKRLDWLEQNLLSIIFDDEDRHFHLVGHRNIKTESDSSVREAIDAALSQTPALVHSETEEKTEEP